MSPDPGMTRLDRPFRLLHHPIRATFLSYPRNLQSHSIIRCPTRDLSGDQQPPCDLLHAHRDRRLLEFESSTEGQQP